MKDGIGKVNQLACLILNSPDMLLQAYMLLHSDFSDAAITSQSL
jgi:hypothetical protein